MNKTYKIQLPRNKEAQNIRTNIKDGTIEVEVELKEKWEPRDGEICFAMTSSGMWKFILIYGKSNWPCIYNESDSGWVLDYRTNWSYSIIRPATNSEKQLLFDALAKEGKMWDAEKKQVVDLPRWRAEKDCKYYYVATDGKALDDYDGRNTYDRNRHNAGNYFKTEKAAERVAEQIREIFKNSKAE